ncbi:gamma-tubulin complex component 5 isoform X2 [Ricinus communis]|uniref:gamma-tubulin complex component 5 isoform X2 n=1 Tax=Ricinus communis TaxID=3988 RepID=UPI000772216B|nr:gamma-tubulin complex component 5 isoform X2 [Ricinus communis]|eukprot:XP_015582101.1 gamma-tubulin complex component 5 isoform X2 [Ricinus communis]
MSAQTPSSLILGNGIHYATPIISSTKTNELKVVQCVLRMMQGLSSSLFYWDKIGQSFCVVKNGIFVTHLSYTSLNSILSQFIYSATCLQLVQVYVNRLNMETNMPTLRAFASSVSQWVKRLRDIALKEEIKMCRSNVGITPTLLGLSSSLSSLCSGAECLLQIVQGSIPQVYFQLSSSISASEVSVHILDYLYKKLDEVCLVQGGEEEAYLMILHILVGSLLPYIEGLDSWLFKGTLDDPFEEMYFYADRGISVDECEFWEKSYQLRQVQIQKFDVKGKYQNNKGLQLCPSFIQNIAKSIVSAGKSLQLIRHVPVSLISGKNIDSDVDGFGGSQNDNNSSSQQLRISGLTLSEIFCVSVAGLIGQGDHISRNLLKDDPCKSEIVHSLVSDIIRKKMGKGNAESCPAFTCSLNISDKVLDNTLSHEKVLDVKSTSMDGMVFPDTEEELISGRVMDEFPLQRSFCPENPVITVCQTLLDEHKGSWKILNLSKHFHLPPLNDEVLRETVFGCESEVSSAVNGTDYTFGFQFGKSEYLCLQDSTKLLEALFPFPTLLPPFQDDVSMSELLPVQKNSTLASSVLSWILSIEPRAMPLPLVIMQECLTVYIKKQVDYIGHLILSKLMRDWRLMDELAVLRAIYLLGSGDLLQHFLTVIFGKLDKGETWDDDFELNLILQESIRNSADSMLLSAPDSLFVSITKSQGFDGDELPSTPTLTSTPRQSRSHSFGIDGLDSLKFTYKVSWPLELIFNAEAINKYNQVMRFLLKVKRAKFVLDKVRRWMWKGRGLMANIHKRHWLVEQKLLHFVDAFHQYVMDRVYHSAWHELCEGMATAGSLDEVIEVHEAYLLSIQRQCFVVPDKLWALIASRINSILGLALDFYSIQQTLSSGGATSAMKARCEMEVDRIEKRFDDCISFLLRILSFKLNVGHFPHLADLVTRINYNYFYMSDSGNLMTATSSESATSRLGKTFGAS